MKKKALSLLLASAMVASMAACGGGSTPAESSSSAPAESSAQASSEVAEEPYVLNEINITVDGTLTATVDNGQKEFNEQLNEAISERAGYDVVVNIEQLDHSTYGDAIGRKMVSNDLPDAMIMNASMFREYSTTGILWDMADAYDNAEFQSRITLPAINENLKDSQGHLYGFTPAYGNGCVTYVKQTWLDAVGMKIEDIKTFDDYYAMLKAFHEQDPDGNGTTGDTYGVVAAGFANTGEAPYINYMPEFWQGAYPYILQDENGTWYDGVQTDATKEALKRLRQGYVDQVIDPETLTATTKIAREKFFSNEQSGSSGAFTYWAGTWYQTLTDNMKKNEVEGDLVQLAPIQEIKDTWGGYLNREAPVWVIIDDGDGDDRKEQAVFSLLLDSMLDGDRIQTLWTYGAEDVHWSTKAEEFKTDEGTDKEKSYSYADGEFHLKQSPNDKNTLWKKNHIDNALVIAPLTNGYASNSKLAEEGNAFFSQNCVDAPVSPASATLTDEGANIVDAINVLISSVVVDGVDVDTAMDTYVSKAGATVEAALAELNAQ